MSQKAHLVGYLKPTADPEGFLLPVFQVEGSNGLSTQRIDKNGIIAGFEQVFPQELREAPKDAVRAVSTGDAAIWGYADKSGNASFEPRAALQTHLRTQLTETRDPFLQLQIARFCEAEAELADAWRSAFSHLDKHAPRSALAWRDMVVLPGAIRAAVAEVASDHGIVEDNAYWDHAVQTQTRNERLTLHLASPLFRLFNDVHGPRHRLQHRTATVRAAFGIQTDDLDLVEIIGPDAEQPSPAPSAPLTERITIALGSMAENIVRSANQKQRPPSALPFGVRVDQSLQAFDPMLVLRGNEIVDETRLDDNFPSSLIGDPDDMLIVFQLGTNQLQLLEAACRISDRYRSMGAHVTAVIPHLPDTLFASSGPAEEFPRRLSANFDAIWFLSDRSANVRQGLPFGPARSSSVATRHFRFMVDRAGDWIRLHPPKAPAPSGVEVIVVGSADGDRMAPSLLDHAIMRILHPELDLSVAKEAMIVSDAAPQQHVEIVKSFASREFPQAGLLVEPRGRTDTRYGEVIIAARAVAMRPAGPHHYEEMCANQLAKADWEVDYGVKDGIDLVIRRGDERLQIECKFDFEEAGSGNYKARIGRKWRDDVVLITTRAVRRKQFLRHVLNGQTTVHYSRISALRLIHRRRFAHVMAAISRNYLDVERDIIPACLNWLAVQDEVVDLLSVPARVELSDHDKLDHGVGHGIYSFRLPLLVKAARQGERVMPALVTAQVVLDGEGWRLVMLKPQ